MRIFQYQTFLGVSIGDWWLSLRWALATFSVLVVLTLAGSFVPYEYVLTHGHPWLPTKTCTGCALCGMTRAFCAMSAHRWSEALDWNPLGPLAYCAAWTWVTLCAIFVGHAARKKLGNYLKRQDHELGLPQLKPVIRVKRNR